LAKELAVAQRGQQDSQELAAICARAARPSTVFADGRPVLSCLTLAITCEGWEGWEVTTRSVSRARARSAVVGAAPAIAKAIYHATGRRFNNLPNRIEDVL
jgi:hypothetical protein